MSIDTVPILAKVAELADELEDRYGDDAEVGAALIIVEVLVGDDDGTNVVEHRSTTRSTAHALGLASIAALSISTPDNEDE